MLCSESRLTAGLTACKPCRIRSLNALAGKQYSGTTPHLGHLAGRHLVLAPRAALCKHLHTGRLEVLCQLQGEHSGNRWTHGSCTSARQTPNASQDKGLLAASIPDTSLLRQKRVHDVPRRACTEPTHKRCGNNLPHHDASCPQKPRKETQFCGPCSFSSPPQHVETRF